MSAGLSIRPGATADAAAAGDIAVRAWQRVHDSYVIEMGEYIHGVVCKDWQDKKRGEVLRVFLSPYSGEGKLIAEEEGVVVGFLTYAMDYVNKIGTIYNNAVEPGCSGRGVGTRMYEHVLALFRDAGMVVANVGTGLDEGHAPARRAYEKAGFNVSVKSVAYYMTL